MLVVPNPNESCDVDKSYIDTELKKKVDESTYNKKIKELESQMDIIFETVEG